MKRTMSFLTAAIFAGAMALPAFAQVGAGVAGNATVGVPSMHAGANSDVANSDAERAEPASPNGTSPPVVRRHTLHSENSTTSEPSESRSSDRNVGGSAGTSDTHVGAGAKAPSDNTPN